MVLGAGGVAAALDDFLAGAAFFVAGAALATTALGAAALGAAALGAAAGAATAFSAAFFALVGTAAFLNTYGITVFATDHRGHGYTAGSLEKVG